MPKHLPKIDLVYFNAGGGHRAAALALASVIHDLGWPWQVRPVNLMDVLDPQSKFFKLTGMRPEDYYNQRLARGWTAGLAQELKLLQAMIRLGHQPMRRQLEHYWLAGEPDLVVSLVPNFNRAMRESLAAALPGVPYVTLLTDLADHPPNFWIEARADCRTPQHFICGTPRAVEQAGQAGHDTDHVHATSGMILRPEFYRPTISDATARDAARRELGLEPQRPTGLVMFGGQGSKAMRGIAEALNDRQLILVCGHNRALADRLRALRPSAPHAVVGYTDDIPRLMQLADYFIGKPGPGSISEAVQQQLPVIVTRNAWTMPQERYNTDWVRENGAGLVLKSFSAIGPAVTELMARLDDLRVNLRRIDNRAVFEVPQILARLLTAQDHPPSRQDWRTGITRPPSPSVPASAHRPRTRR
jgi:UDP-N-acetylglucosamine:LPS N-acetylglucosamine transferase